MNRYKVDLKAHPYGCLIVKYTSSNMIAYLDMLAIYVYCAEAIYFNFFSLLLWRIRDSLRWSG